ncbi:MAG: hypothetical protein J6S96_07235 [Muribaculaceae bacterium]|nr:hypothetical protein [Muribaculaceae bacterium]
MKKFYSLLMAALAVIPAYAIDKQTYAELPDYFPAAFTMDMTRNDYRGTDDNGDPVLVSTDFATVEWNPTYMNGSACYGKLTITNFFDNECVQNAATIEFTNENNMNFMVSEDGKQITFSFTAFLFSMAKTEAPYNNAYGKYSQYAFVAAARQGDSHASRYWMSGDYVSYAYNGGTACNCVLDLDAKTITINQPWGGFMLYDRYGAAPSYVIEYFEKSIFEESNPTAITDIDVPATATDDAYYTITGQRVLNPTPGFYIHNGKKVVIK